MNLINILSDRVGVLEADLTKTKQTYSSAYTKLILRVKKLEAQIKVGKARRHSRFVLSDTEGVEDDSSKQGRKFSNEGFKDDEGVHEKASTETELFIQEITPTEVIHEQEGSGKASDEISTAGKKKDTASEEVPPVSTAEVHISTAGETATYSRRSAEKRKDKGKGIMTDEEPKKKSKKELEQERLSFAEAIRIEEQMHEEQRAQIARDAEIARQWEEEEKKKAMDEAESTKKIDWNDPSVLRYHSLKMKPKSIAQARRNMVKYLKNQGNFKIPLILRGYKDSEKIVEEDIFMEFWCYKRKGKKLLEDKIVLTETSCIIKIFRGDGSSKKYKILRGMLRISRRNWIKRRLHDFCGIHILLMNNGLAIHMLTEKKYPLSQEMLSKMLSTRLEVDHESSQAFELLDFIRAQSTEMTKVFERSQHTKGVSTASTGLVLPAQVNTANET
ncbi:hypothetical protein Tco_1362816 [Tanacetum coccineum]